MKTTAILFALTAASVNASADDLEAYFDPSLDYSRSSAELAADPEVDSVTTSEETMSDRLFLKFGPGWGSFSSYTAATDDVHRRTSVYAGAEYERPVTGEFSVSAGLYYLEKGIDVPKSNYSMRFDYLTLPVMAKFGFRLSDRQRVSVAVGPYVSYALRAEELQSTVFGLQAATDRATPLSRFDFGTRFGADYDFTIKSGFSFLVGAAYELGMSNLDKQSINFTSTRAFMANIGLGLRI